MKQIKVKVQYTDNFKDKYTRAIVKTARKRHAESKNSSSDYRDIRAVCHSNSFCAGANLTHDSSND